MYILKGLLLAAAIVLPMNIIGEIFKLWMYRKGKQIKSESPELYQKYLSSTRYSNSTFPYNQISLLGSTALISSAPFRQLISLGQETLNPSLVRKIKIIRVVYWLVLILYYGGVFYWLEFHFNGIKH